jgi:23S rRNA (adenine2503-C2)-methyltransferase
MGSSPRQVRWFRDRLRALGVNATVRQNRGTDIDAACGQLRAGHEATPVSTPRRRVEPMPTDEPTALNEPGP